VGSPPLSVLDVSCGIGTQTLGLAALGHRLTASDVSVAAVEHAQREVSQRRLPIAFRVGDMQLCRDLHGSVFDVVLSADKAVPHLLSDEAILEAFRGF
jgi:2-polyprenyl-3-methyl-5-hydroxy-6-metoxy-1,4-benzoquinol methylase